MEHGLSSYRTNKCRCHVCYAASAKYRKELRWSRAGIKPCDHCGSILIYAEIARLKEKLVAMERRAVAAEQEESVWQARAQGVSL